MDWEDIGYIVIVMIVAFWAFLIGGAVGMSADAVELPNGCILHSDVIYCPVEE